MAKNIAGSIRKVVLDGVTYDAVADGDFSEVGSQYENTAIQTSGRTIRKMVKRSASVDNVKLACNAAEKDALKALADGLKEITMSYMTADGSQYKAQGFIEFKSRSTAETSAEVTMIPTNGTWETFMAA